MKKAEGGSRRVSALVALSALGVVAFVFFAISCGGSGTGQSGSNTERATVTKREPTVTNEQSPTNVAPDRPVVGVKAVGSPSLVARLRHDGVQNGGLDADGDFVAWIDAECSVHFIRLSDKRQAVVPYEFCVSENDGPGKLALLGSRAVWSLVGAGMSSAHATVFTAMFGDAEPHALTTAEGQCESDYCSFRGPLIDSSGGSLVFVEGAAAPQTKVLKLVDGAFKPVRVHVGLALAVHGKELAVLSDKNIVELRRLDDGSLIRKWRALHPKGKFGKVALASSLLVIQSDDQPSPGRWIDLYETATGQLIRSIPGAAEVWAQPFADGVVFFSGRRLVYVGTTADPITLATTRGDPVALVISRRRAFWIEYERSWEAQRLYSIELRSTP